MLRYVNEWKSLCWLLYVSLDDILKCYTLCRHDSFLFDVYLNCQFRAIKSGQNLKFVSNFVLVKLGSLLDHTNLSQLAAMEFWCLFFNPLFDLFVTLVDEMSSVQIVTRCETKRHQCLLHKVHYLLLFFIYLFFILIFDLWSEFVK